jgi:hypothetical protein
LPNFLITKLNNWNFLVAKFWPLPIISLGLYLKKNWCCFKKFSCLIKQWFDLHHQLLKKIDHYLGDKKISIAKLGSNDIERANVFTLHLGLLSFLVSIFPKNLFF